MLREKGNVLKNVYTVYTISEYIPKVAICHLGKLVFHREEEKKKIDEWHACAVALCDQSNPIGADCKTCFCCKLYNYVPNWNCVRVESLEKLSADCSDLDRLVLEAYLHS